MFEIVQMTNAIKLNGRARFVSTRTGTRRGVALGNGIYHSELIVAFGSTRVTLPMTVT